MESKGAKHTRQGMLMKPAITKPRKLMARIDNHKGRVGDAYFLSQIDNCIAEHGLRLVNDF